MLLLSKSQNQTGNCSFFKTKVLTNDNRCSLLPLQDSSKLANIHPLLILTISCAESWGLTNICFDFVTDEDSGVISKLDASSGLTVQSWVSSGVSMQLWGVPLLTLIFCCQCALSSIYLNVQNPVAAGGGCRSEERIYSPAGGDDCVKCWATVNSILT